MKLPRGWLFPTKVTFLTRTFCASTLPHIIRKNCNLATSFLGSYCNFFLYLPWRDMRSYLKNRYRQICVFSTREYILKSPSLQCHLEFWGKERSHTVLNELRSQIWNDSHFVFSQKFTHKQSSIINCIIVVEKPVIMIPFFRSFGVQNALNSYNEVFNMLVVGRE